MENLGLFAFILMRFEGVRRHSVFVRIFGGSATIFSVLTRYWSRLDGVGILVE